VSRVSRIFHIATRADWNQARADGSYTRSTVDATLAEVGFIHASQVSQVAEVANKYYRGVAAELVVLVIDTDLVEAEVRYDHVPGAELPYPHIYGPLNADAVIALMPLAPGEDGTFAFPPLAMADEIVLNETPPNETGEAAGEAGAAGATGS
jgi:uncharacterized protein (DUF952 family)